MGNEKAECPICFNDITDENPNIAVFTCSVDEKLHFVCTECYDQLDKKECPLDRKVSEVIFTAITPESHLSDFEDHLLFYPTFLSGMQKTLAINLTEQTVGGTTFLKAFIDKLKGSEYLPYLIYKILTRNGSLSHLKAGDKYDVIMRNAPIAYAEVIVKSSDNIDLLHQVARCRLTKNGEADTDQRQFQAAAYAKLVKLIVFSDTPYFNLGQRKLIWDAQKYIPDILPKNFVTAIMRLSDQKIEKKSLEIALQLFEEVDVEKNLLGILMQARLTEDLSQDATEIYIKILASNADDKKYFNQECRAFAFKRLTEINQTESPEYNLYVGKNAPNNEPICDRVIAIITAITGPSIIEKTLNCLLEISDLIKQNQDAQILVMRLGVRIIRNQKLYHKNIITLLEKTQLLHLFTKPKSEVSFWNFLATQNADLTIEFAEFFLPENKKYLVSERQKNFLYSLNTKNMPNIIKKTIAGIKFNSYDKNYRISK